MPYIDDRIKKNGLTQQQIRTLYKKQVESYKRDLDSSGISSLIKDMSKVYKDMSKYPDSRAILKEIENQFSKSRDIFLLDKGKVFTTKEAIEDIDDMIDLFQKVDNFLKEKNFLDGKGAAFSQTSLTIIKNLKPIVDKYRKRKNVDTHIQAFIKKTKRRVNGLISQMAEVSGGIQIASILESMNLGHNVKLSGEGRGPQVPNLKDTYFGKDVRDVIATVSKGGKKGNLTIAVTVKDYTNSSSSGRKKYIDTNLRGSSLGTSLLYYINNQFKGKNLNFSNKMKKEIAFETMVNFHNRRFGIEKKYRARQDFFSNLQDLLKIILVDIIFAQGNIVNQGVQLTIINRKLIFDLEKVLPKSINNWDLSHELNLLTNNPSSYPGSPSYDQGIDNNDAYMYLQRYSSMKLHLRGKIYF